MILRLNSFRSFKPDANGLSLWNLASTASAGVAGTAPLQTDSKEESITYDRNGNLSNYQRWGTGSATLMDNMGYVLYPNSNRLEYVVDGVAAATFGSDFDGQSPANYAYDGAGNLIKDAQSGISTGDILWTPYGKVRQVNVFGGNSVTKYDYDAQQNRVFKSIQNFVGTNNTYYVRDILGRVMATYTQNGSTFTWAEQHLYGSSRLGLLRPEVSWSSAPPAIPHFASTRLLRYGAKRYEVNDHLGNVRASISDRRQFSSTIFDPVITDATDYFPFGAPNRTVSSSTGYRYGFNGKELDKSNEFGTANVYDYGFRIYNPSIGRFLSVDPLTRSYAELTPYQFASNTPIMAIDLDGLESWIVTYNHKPNQAVPSVTWRLDMNREHKKLIYVYHKHWNAEGRMTFMRSNVATYSDYPKEFPVFGSDEKTPLITTEGYFQFIYGEVALKVPSNTNMSFEFGAEGVIAGWSLKNGKWQKPTYLDGSDPEWNVGAGFSFGKIGTEYRKQYFPARGEWGEPNLEVDINPWGNSAGVKIASNLESAATSLQFGIPEYKVALGIGIKGGASASLNIPGYSSKEWALLTAVAMKRLHQAIQKASSGADGN